MTPDGIQGQLSWLLLVRCNALLGSGWFRNQVLEVTNKGFVEGAAFGRPPFLYVATARAVSEHGFVVSPDFIGDEALSMLKERVLDTSERRSREKVELDALSGRKRARIGNALGESRSKFGTLGGNQ